ncbi:hypothetical protein A8M77_06220 [Variovorax sp. JS1663]|nr:hypothetical protein A8M77_06220 [Variovorax sp. JS1663]
MISFDAHTHRFNLRAAAVVLHEGAVLLHRIEGDDFWSMPADAWSPARPAGSRLLAGPVPFLGSEDGLALTFAWFDCTRLDEIEVRPSVLARALASPERGFRHVIHHEREAG